MYYIFADNLRKCLKEKHITQKILAKYLGVSNTAVNAYVMGLNYPDVENLLKIAEFLDVSIDYLLTGKKPENAIAIEELGLSNEVIEQLRKVKTEKFNDIRVFIQLFLSDEKFFQCLKVARNLFGFDIDMSEYLEKKAMENEERVVFPNETELLKNEALRPAARIRDYFFNLLVEKAKIICPPEENYREKYFEVMQYQASK